MDFVVREVVKSHEVVACFRTDLVWDVGVERLHVPGDKKRTRG